MEDTIEVRYAGVVVGRTAAVRGLDAEGAFIGMPEPLPVGTLVTLKLSDGIKEAHVSEVLESADPDAVGMRVRFGAVSAPVMANPGAEPESEADDDESAPIPAPLSHAEPNGNGGGGKKRRKRR